MLYSLPFELHAEIVRQAWRSARCQRFDPSSLSRARARTDLFICAAQVSRAWRTFMLRLVWEEVQCITVPDFIFYVHLRAAHDVRSAETSMDGPTLGECTHLHVSADYLLPCSTVVGRLDPKKYPQASLPSLASSSARLFTDARTLSVFMNERWDAVAHWLRDTHSVSRVIILKIMGGRRDPPTAVVQAWAAPDAGNRRVTEVEVRDGRDLASLGADVWLAFPAVRRVLLATSGSLRPLALALPAHIMELVLDAPPLSALDGRASLAPWLLYTALADGLLQGARTKGRPAPCVVVRTGALAPVGWDRALEAASSRGIRLEHVCTYP
jgi:hypothetical protein